MLAERFDEGRLLLTHEVQIQLIPPLIDICLQPRAVPTEVARDVHRFPDLFGGDVRTDDVERLDGLDVPARRRGEDVAPPLVVGDGQRFVVGGRPAEVDLQSCRSASAGLAIRVQDLLQRLLGLVHGDECVRPRGVTRGGLRGDGRTHQVGDGVGQRPQPSPVDVHETLVADLLAGQQSPDDVNAFDEALIANLLARPDSSGHPLVRCLARSECRPESTRKHLRKRRDGLGDDRRVVALPGGIDNAERNIRRRKRGAKEGPGEARFALTLAPRAEVVRGHACGEAGLFSLLDVLQQLGRTDLFVRAVKADDRHGQRHTRSGDRLRARQELFTRRRRRCAAT